MDKRRRYFVNSFSRITKPEPSEINFKKILNFIKEYSTLIGGITLFLGGFHQFFSLFSIGAGYVRFFSVTQLLSDGFVVLIVGFGILFWLIFIFLIIFPYLFQNRFAQAKSWQDSVESRDFLVIISLLVFYMFLVPFYKIPGLFNGYFYDNSNLSDLALLQIRILVAGSIVILIGNFSYWKEWSKKAKRNFNIAVSIPSIIMIFFFLDYAFDEVAKIFLPVNLNNINCIVSNENKTEVLYFNDNYIFYKEPKINNDIRILKLDDLLEMEPCANKFAKY